MVNIRDARRLVKRGETATSYFGAETSVIVTTTVSDEILDLLRWEDELEIIREFAPAYHIPADYSTYDADTPEIREENIAECMEGTIWFEQQLRDSKTGIIPILKGTNSFERNICYRMLQGLNDEYVAYYVTQYFTGGDGIRIHQLVEDVTTIGGDRPRPTVGRATVGRNPQQAPGDGGRVGRIERVADRRRAATCRPDGDAPPIRTLRARDRRRNTRTVR